MLDNPFPYRFSFALRFRHTREKDRQISERKKSNGLVSYEFVHKYERERERGRSEIVNQRNGGQELVNVG